MPAFYIVLQEKIPGVDAAGLDNFALSKHTEKLETLAKQAGVTPLLHFFSPDPEEMAGLLGEHSAAVKIPVQIPEEKWFSPEDGLQTIGVLLQSLANTLSAEGPTLEVELKEFQRVLQAARSRNIRWHLAIDY
jgi:hypothetical protein